MKLNQKIQTADSLTVQALHVVVLPSSGGNAPLVDLVVAESKVAANGPVCDPAKQNDGTGKNQTLGQICPTGSELNGTGTLCIIPAGTAGSGLGQITVGRPYQGPSGGSVLPLDVARKRYGNSPCLSGNGTPKFAIVGTSKRRPHHRHEHRRPDHRARRQRQARRRAWQRLHRGSRRRRHDLRRARR